MPGLDEFGAIARYLAPLAAGFPGAFGLSDDAATLSVPPGRELVITIDTLVEGVHFLAGAAADGLAAKLLAVNLSDLAAMGAQPRAYLLSVSLPHAWLARGLEDWLELFATGLRHAQNEHDVHLIGGDTVVTPGPLSLTVTALGDVAAGRALRRNGARVGDAVYVTGAIGDAALGLRVLKGELTTLAADDANTLIGRYHRPRPRIAAGLALVGLARACADVSDGLIADLGHICATSGVAATLDARLLPLSMPVRAAVEATPALLATILGGGDDYELVFTAPPEDAARIAATAGRLGLAMTAIGRIEPRRAGEPAVRVFDCQGRPFVPAKGGYRHF